MSTVKSYVLAALAGIAAGYFAYTYAGGRYYFFDKPHVRNARFDSLTGSLTYDNPVKQSIPFRLSPTDKIWDGLAPDTEILVDAKSLDPVLANSLKYGPQVIVRGTHPAKEETDFDGVRVWVSGLDQTVRIRADDSAKYNWDTVENQKNRPPPVIPPPPPPRVTVDAP